MRASDNIFRKRQYVTIPPIKFGYIIIAIIIFSVSVSNYMQFREEYKYYEAKLDNYSIADVTIDDIVYTAKEDGVDGHYTAIGSFDYNGNSYKKELLTFKSEDTYKVGDKVTIHFSKTNPDDIWYGQLEMSYSKLIYSVFFALLSLAIIFGTVYKSAYICKLIIQNKYILVTDWYLLNNMSIEQMEYIAFDRHPRIAIDTKDVKCKLIATYRLSEFRSISFDSDWMYQKDNPYKKSEPVKVYVDLDKAPDKYFVSMKSKFKLF